MLFRMCFAIFGNIYSNIPFLNKGKSMYDMDGHMILIHYISPNLTQCCKRKCYLDRNLVLSQKEKVGRIFIEIWSFCPSGIRQIFLGKESIIIGFCSR